MKTFKAKQVSKSFTVQGAHEALNHRIYGIEIAKSLGYMKTRISMSIASLIFLCTLIPSPAIAEEQGGSEGGGHRIESQFKAHTLTLAHELSQLLEPAKAQLQFDTDALEGTLNARGRFSPLCADHTVVEIMRAEGKMARVFAQSPAVVYLDCTNYTEQQWQDIFESGTPEDKMFLLHEALRIAGHEGENDYNKSSSYLKALREQARLEKKLYMALIYPKVGAQCAIQLHESKLPIDRKVFITLTIEGKLFTRSVFGFYSSSDEALMYLTNGDLDGYSHASIKAVMNIAKNSASCWNDVINGELTNSIRASAALSGAQSAGHEKESGTKAKQMEIGLGDNSTDSSRRSTKAAAN